MHRTLDARPDTIDFRDRMFVPTLCEVSQEISVEAYEKRLRGKAPILDQGEEGACSGFALAAVCNYLLRTRAVYPDKTSVSAHIYNKSLLYLVSHAFEKKLRLILSKNGWPILGMDKFVSAHDELQKLIQRGVVDYVLAPNDHAPGSQHASCAKHHGDFDDDGPTVRATLARILGQTSIAAEFKFPGSAAFMRDRRRAIS